MIGQVVFGRKEKLEMGLQLKKVERGERGKKS